MLDCAKLTERAIQEIMLSTPTIHELCSDEELRDCVALLRTSFGTVAREFGLNEESAPTNAAFTTLENMRRHLQNGMKLYGMAFDSSLIGCVATKRSKKDELVFYIERLAVIPEKRMHGYGGQLVSFALEQILRDGGATASIGLMDNNDKLKKWYISKGFVQHDRRRIEHLPFKICFMSMDIKKGDLI
jgi:ribosomal protein S18 acetylase RimI-like enzyme